LLGYALEGARLSGGSGSYYEASADTAIGNTSVASGEKVYVSHAGHDASCFPDPQKVDPRRPVDAYLQYKSGPHAFLDGRISQVALTEMFRALFKRKNLKRAPGPQGELKKITRADGKVEYLREDWGALTAFPVTMKVTWDD